MRMLTTPRRFLPKFSRAVAHFCAAAALALVPTLGTAPVRASAPPVGRLVNESVTTVSTTRAALVAVALPSPTDGQSWRLARDLDPKVLQQVSEAQVGNNVVIVFAATGPGTARIVFALTHGESSAVSRAVTQVVTVR